MTARENRAAPTTHGLKSLRKLHLIANLIDPIIEGPPEIDVIEPPSLSEPGSKTVPAEQE